MNTIENINFVLLMKNYTIHPFDPRFFIGVGGVVEHNGNLENMFKTW
jgi:hypothetical protein